MRHDRERAHGIKGFPPVNPTTKYRTLRFEHFLFALNTCLFIPHRVYG